MRRLTLRTFGHPVAYGRPFDAICGEVKALQIDAVRAEKRIAGVGDFMTAQGAARAPEGRE